ncbi:MAG: S-layer homology domain-containing protein, partial [Oscillospiraceae bacterium]
MKSKRSLALLLSVAMVISMLLMPAAAAETAPISAKPVFTDTAAHWAEKAIDRWSGYGIIKGDAGAFKPDADMTRAELATVLTNLLRLSVKAENTYADLVGTEWYAGGILKCTSAGIMKGDGKNCNAMAPISRQEATVMIARALGVKAAETPDLSAFKDAASVATWAVGYVSAMAKSGIINGVGDGMLAPTTNINRASVMTILDRAITDYINKPGEYTITSTGLVVVTVPNVVLKNSKLNDLLVAEGVGEGDFTLNSTKVAGNATVRGGGVNSFVVMGASDMGSITISKVDGAVRVSVQGDAQVRVIFIDDGKDDVFIEGKVGAVTVSTDTPVTLRGADVKTVTATGENADITVDRTSKVETVASSSANTTVTVAGTVTTVAGTKEAEGMSVNVSKGGTATNVVTAAPNTTLANDGKVGQASFAKEATGAKIVVG